MKVYKFRGISDFESVAVLLGSDQTNRLILYVKA
jgi:hypothetical protein